MDILRNKEFQELMENYDRARNPFYVSYSTVDTVSSDLMFKYGEKSLQPADYLEQFSIFINENKEKIEALTILFNNPRKWNSAALKEIRNEMKRNSFQEEKVQQAHRLTGHKALADIISMIKNAKDHKNPLLTASERVETAITKLMKKSTFNTEQTEWLNYIKEHLIINLAIDKDNFDLVPVLERHGGLAKAKKVFGNQFEEIIEMINEAVAA
jgi:type I restriction enzyme R subunit